MTADQVVNQEKSGSDDSNDTSSEIDPSPPQKNGLGRLLLITLVFLLVGAGLGVFVSLQNRAEKQQEQFRALSSEAVNKEEWGRLEIVAQKWLDWDADNNDALMFLAEAQLQSGELAEAADTLGRVSDGYQAAIAALSYRGEILSSDLHLAYEAESTWKRILELDPENTHAHQRLITFYALSIQRQKMVDQIRESMKRNAEPPEAYAYLILTNAMGFTSGLVQVQNWRKHYPEDETFEVAEAIYKAKYENRSKADDEFEKSPIAPGNQTLINDCLKKYPQNIEILAFHLELNAYFGKTDRVIELLQKAPPEAMKDARFWRHRAWLLRQTQQQQKGLEALEKSLEIDPFSWRSRWLKAEILRQLGREQEAIETQELAIAGKLLEEKLYKTDGRALKWGLVMEMHGYIEQLGQTEVLSSLNYRIRSQGGESMISDSGPEDPGKQPHSLKGRMKQVFDQSP
ncbi:MAG: hypothetical protein HUJ26_14945 [Planctomycetaceae bacterium]|nr:hypothetical protein [Planctomycetaceae bacterium]